MKSCIFLLLLVFTFSCIAADHNGTIAPNGMAYPADYKQWSPIGVSHRTDKHSLRLILANPIAKKAIEMGKTNPWPNGSMIGKIVWKDSRHKDWKSATVPGRLIHTEFMLKDAIKYKKTGGWGFARWLGNNQKPFGNTSSEHECYSCHLNAKNTDIVFTRPIVLP
jgi:hypothetical protein